MRVSINLSISINGGAPNKSPCTMVLIVGTPNKAPHFWKLPYRDLESRQGEPAQTDGDYWGLLGTCWELLGSVRPYYGAQTLLDRLVGRFLEII